LILLKEVSHLTHLPSYELAMECDGLAEKNKRRKRKHNNRHQRDIVAVFESGSELWNHTSATRWQLIEMLHPQRIGTAGSSFFRLVTLPEFQLDAISESALE
jgi:hypothetical protein